MYALPKKGAYCFSTNPKLNPTAAVTKCQAVGNSVPVLVKKIENQNSINL